MHFNDLVGYFGWGWESVGMSLYESENPCVGGSIPPGPTLN